MTDWQHTFRAKVTNADAAARRVKSGDLVRLPLGPVPLSLLNALARRRDELRGVRVWQGATTYEHPWTDEPGWEEQIEYVTDFVSPQTRDAMKARRIDFAVGDFSIGSKVQAAGRHDTWAADVFMALVSEPDANGYVSFGFGLWYTKALLRAAKFRIAEVGRNVLRTGGDNFVHLSEFDAVVELGSPVSLAYFDRRPFPFTGKISSVTVQLDQ